MQMYKEIVQGVRLENSQEEATGEKPLMLEVYHHLSVGDEIPRFPMKGAYL